MGYVEGGLSGWMRAKLALVAIASQQASPGQVAGVLADALAVAPPQRDAQQERGHPAGPVWSLDSENLAGGIKLWRHAG